MTTFDEWWAKPAVLSFPDTSAELKEWCREAVEATTLAGPLEDVFALVRVENEESNEKHTDWRELPPEKQAEAIANEYVEWAQAYEVDDHFGDHGEVAELLDLMNVAAKRIIYLSQLAERVANNDPEKGFAK